jgi:hypothetical protein
MRWTWGCTNHLRTGRLREVRWNEDRGRTGRCNGVMAGLARRYRRAGHELESLGLTDEVNALSDARRLRPVILGQLIPRGEGSEGKRDMPRWAANGAKEGGLN